jgi:type VI secretion system protein ImpA
VASARWESRELLQPITADQPCGESLEDTELLASFDAFGVFGHSTPLDAPAEPGEKRIPKPPESPVWAEIQQKALDALGKSKDLRLLAYLGTALLRTEGLLAFCETLGAASQWLDAYWSEVYPRIDEDAMLRRNALSCLADPMAVIDRVWRAPLVSNRQLGRFSLRDIEIAAGQVSAGEGVVRAAAGQIDAAFAAMPDEELRLLQVGIDGALAAVTRIEATMLDQGGPEAAPGLDPLSAQLGKIARVLHAQLARRSGDEGDAHRTGGDGAARPVGAIASREEAVRALDAVAEFFRRNEPSSPIPMIVERAKRLVSKDFLEVLADIAPEALASARAAGGVRMSE